MERKRKSRFDIPPEAIPDPPTGSITTITTPTNAIEDFILKYGLDRLPVLPSSNKVGVGKMTPFGLSEMSGLMNFMEKDPQEELFKDKLKKAMEKNLEYLKKYVLT